MGPSIRFAARRGRPAHPSCRGGASSVLRLSQPLSSGVTGWLSRAGAWALQQPRSAMAAALVPPAEEWMQSIITPLAPSAEWAQS